MVYSFAQEFFLTFPPLLGASQPWLKSYSFITDSCWNGLLKNKKDLYKMEISFPVALELPEKKMSLMIKN